MHNPILLSIRPEHLSKIFSGEKIFEFRKVLPKKKFDYIVFYESTPTCRVVGCAKVEDVFSGSLPSIWKKTAYRSGISKRYFMEYFSGSSSANAICLGSVYKLAEPLSIEEVNGNQRPPQSFLYLKDSEIFRLRKMKKRQVVKPSAIFLGGIHGSGKTFLSENLFKLSGYKCFTASTLIRQAGGSLRASKMVDDVEYNQKVLIRQICKERKRAFRFLLDGHFTLRGENNLIQQIPIDVFQQMHLNKLILLEDYPEKIAMRLKSRDGKDWDPIFLSKFMDAERVHAEHIAQSLSIPLLVVRGENMMPILKRTLFKERG